MRPTVSIACTRLHSIEVADGNPIVGDRELDPNEIGTHGSGPQPPPARSSGGRDEARPLAELSDFQLDGFMITAFRKARPCRNSVRVDRWGVHVDPGGHHGNKAVSFGLSRRHFGRTLRSPTSVPTTAQTRPRRCDFSSPIPKAAMGDGSTDPDADRGAGLWRRNVISNWPIPDSTSDTNSRTSKRLPLFSVCSHRNRQRFFGG